MTFPYGSPIIAAMIVIATVATIPLSCTRIESGSMIDISSGSVSSSLHERFSHETGDGTGEFRYGLVVHGAGDDAASGEARTSFELLIRKSGVGQGGIMEQLNYDETTGIFGKINSFSKLLTYTSL